MDRRFRGVVLVLVLLGACLPLAGTAAAAKTPKDPPHDVIGWENGYWYNETIHVDQRDGLSPAELNAYVSRAEARDEVITHTEFNHTVPVVVVNRSDYANQTSDNASDAYRAWNNQVWEALFIVGEDQDVQQALHSTTTASTLGAYFYKSKEIKIITDTPDHPTIDRGTLAHELTHALQDQHYNLSSPKYAPVTQDGELAQRGLIEGEARYVQQQYQQHCRTDWQCVANPPSSGDTSGGDVNYGIYVTLYQPYSDGPPYVNGLVQHGGWQAVDGAFASPPNSTEQIIHQTNEAPAPLPVENDARNGWEPFPKQGRNGTDTAGEASIFAMFWYQARQSGADTIPTNTLFDTNAPYDTYNYDAPPSAGWANDTIMPYHKTTASGTQYGYVWRTKWDTVTDAEQFQRAYMAILDAHDARSVGPRTWVIDAGPFADAFRVVRTGDRVTIVNAPHASELDDLDPSLAPTATPTSPATRAPAATQTPRSEEPGSPMAPAESPSEDGGVTTAPPQPGFGVLAALGVLLVWAARRRRRR